MIKSKVEVMKDVGKNYHQLITIQEFREVIDEYGTPIDQGWQGVATVWASVEPIRGREYILLQNIQSELAVRIRIRHRVGITPGMRVLYGTRVFDVQSVIDPEERHRDLQLMCIEKVGDT